MTGPVDPTLLLEALEQVGDAVIVLDREQHRVRFVNASAQRELGVDADHLLGRTLPSALPELAEEPVRSAYLAALSTGRPQQARTFLRATDHWCEGRITPGEHTITVSFREVTSQVRGELRDRVRTAIGQAVTHGADEADGPTLTVTLRTVLAAVRRAIGYDFAELWLVDETSHVPQLLAVDHDGAAARADFAAASAASQLPPTSRVVTAARQGTPCLTRHLDHPGVDRVDALAAAGLLGGVHLPIDLGDTRMVLGWLHGGDGPAHDRAQVIASLHGHLCDLVAREAARHDLDRVFQLSQELIVVCDLQGRVRRVNPAWRRTLGWDAAQLVGRRFDEFVHPDDLGPTRTEVAALRTGTPTLEFENRVRAADGSYRTLRWNSTSVPEHGAMYGIARDITGHASRQAYERAQRDVLVAIALDDPLERTLRRTAEMVESRLADTIVTILLVTADGRRLRHVAGSSVPDAIRDAIDGHRLHQLAGCTSAVADGRTVITSDLASDPRWASLRAVTAEHDLRACWSVPFFDGAGATLGTLMVYRTVAGGPAAEELQLIEDVAPLAGLAVMRERDGTELREREQRFALLARATSDAVWDWDLRSDQVWWGDGVRELFGYEPSELDPTGRAWATLVHPDDTDHVVAVLDRAFVDRSQGRGSTSVEYRFRRADGTYAHVTDRFYVVRDRHGQAVRALGGMTDLSDRRELEAQYLRAQRMESLGTLAGGIAHDLNNVLTPIVMAADLLEITDLDPEQRDLVGTTGTSARRGGEMVQQILSFARGDQPQESSVAVAALLDELRRMTREWFPKDLHLHITLAEGVGSVRGDDTQLQQVLVNLALNARDAMPDGGRLTIAAEAVTLTPSAGSEHPLPAGEYVTLAVRDEGTGMPPGVVTRIFDPFFTTKRSGTGLGLPTCRSIVHNHGGRLEVTSQPGAGSTFTVWLPASDRAAVPIATPPPPPRGHGETLLIADDEAAVRAITRQALESYDYRVLLARDGAEAVALHEASPATIDAALVDLAMPVLDGVATIRALRATAPQLRIVATSGFGEGGRTAEAAAAGVRAFLSKPYRSDELLRTVRSVLDTP